MVMTSRRLWIIGGVVAALLLVVAGYTAGTLVPRWQTPGDASPEAGFARDMSDHHAQAVELGMIAFQRATDPDVRTLGGDIAITQQGQIGIMQTWLTNWGLNLNSTRAPMSWMPDGPSLMRGNLMPGMASQAEMDKLRSATGKQVDILFCQYMLRHHLGGLHMVDGILAASHDDQVVALAQAMKAGQSGEIQVLQSLLTKLGAAPLN
jgi:uncharacterized protein (DUF305 family)